MFRTGPLVICLIAASSGALAQQVPVAVPIRGRVVADDNSRPLRRALIAVAGDRNARAVLTDEGGRFEIGQAFSLVIAKAGYATTTIEIPRRPEADPIEVRLQRGGVISGRIIDSNGESAIGTKVVARVAGSTVRQPATFETEADDLGEYRISGLPAGRYAVYTQAGGPRVITSDDFEQLQALAKQGRSITELLMGPLGRSRLVDVRSEEESAGVDFDVNADQTIRAVAAVRHQVITSLPPGAIVPNAQPRITIGTPQHELGGKRLVQVVGGDSRSLDILFSGGAAITGAIVDSAGEPFQGIVVRALQVRRDNGRMMAGDFGWTRVTDDRGRYRLFGLPAGAYLLVASLNASESDRASSARGFAPVYFPGTSQVEAAQPLNVESAADVTGVDLTFAVSPSVRLRGTVVNAEGHPLAGRVMLGISQRSATVMPDKKSVPATKDGTFELLDVPPGDYVVQAITDAGPGSPSEFGVEYVTVGAGDLPAIAIKTSRGATLEGRFTVEHLSELPSRAVSLHAAPMDLDRSPSDGRGPEGFAAYEDGRFYLTGLFGPMRLTVPSTLPTWYLKSLTIGDVDVTDVPFDFASGDKVVSDAEVVLSDQGATIDGTVDASSDRAASATAIVFSTNRDYWFTGSRHAKKVSLSGDGSFHVTGLPPGEYWVAVVDAPGADDWQSPDVLDTVVTRSTRVSVREGQVYSMTLRPGRSAR